MTKIMKLCAVLILAACTMASALGAGAELEEIFDPGAEPEVTEPVSGADDEELSDGGIADDSGAAEDESAADNEPPEGAEGSEDGLQADDASYYDSPASDITRDCSIKLNSGKAKALYDGDITTTFGDKDDSELRIRFPEGGAGYIFVQWYDEPSEFEFVTVDSEKNVITSITDASAYFAMSSLFRIDSTAVFAGLRTHGSRISELRVYSHGELPASVPNWLSSYEQADMLVFAAHAGDEFGCFGGIIPYYAVEKGKSVQIIFMTKPDDQKKVEALNALWSAGIRHYPIFLDLPADENDSGKELLEKWGGRNAVTGDIVEILRSMRPAVVVTHDTDGENGDQAHILTSAAVHSAVLASSNASEFQESTQDHGTWQVKKLYTHLNAGASGTVIDCTRPSAAFGGSSAEEIAKKAYEIYSDHERKTRGSDTSYTLTYTNTDIDTQKDDFFEKIDIEPQYDADGALVTPTPGPTNEPALLFTETEVIEATSRPDSTDTEFASSIKYLMYAAGAGLGVIALLGLSQVAIYLLRRSRGRRYRE